MITTVLIVDGSIISRGQQVQVQYFGNVYWFLVTSVKPLMTSTHGCHDSLSLDMSNMSLDVDCSTDGAAVDTESIHDIAQTTDSSNDCNFFIITQRSRLIIQTPSSDVASYLIP